MKTESEDIVLEFDLPEFNENDIQVKIIGNKLYLIAEKVHEKSFDQFNFSYEEMARYNFSYVTNLPSVDPNSLFSEFDHGILTIKIKKLNSFN